MNKPVHSPEPDDGDEVVERARHGDTAAFTQLVESYQQLLAGYLWRLTGGSDVAADLTQETFVRAWRALPDSRPGLHIRAWLFRIATNLARDHFRRRERVRWLPLETIESIGVDAMPVPTDDRDPCWLTLARLRPRERSILLLCALEGLSYAEAADVLGVAPDAARKQFTRAKERFRRMYALVEQPPDQ